MTGKATMASKSIPHSSHLLSLPAELLNAIYAYVFEDDLEHELLLIDWKEFLPCSSILQVNQRLRAECLSLYEEARINLGKNHRWLFEVDARFIDADHRNQIARRVEKIPKVIPIQRLSVIFEFPCTDIRGSRPSICIDFTNNEAGIAQWTLTGQALIIQRYRSRIAENALRAAIWERLGPFASHEDSRWLDAQKCIQPFFEIFDRIPYFSALEFWEY